MSLKTYVKRVVVEYICVVEEDDTKPNLLLSLDDIPDSEFVEFSTTRQISVRDTTHFDANYYLTHSEDNDYYRQSQQ